MDQQTNHLHTEEKKKADVVLILNDATLTSLSNHKDKHDLNRSHAYHRDRLKDQITKSDNEVLFFLSKYSLKFCGVSYLAKRTIATKLKCSERTVQRAINKLERLGAIEVFPTRRRGEAKGQAPNIVRFVRMPEASQSGETNGSETAQPGRLVEGIVPPKNPPVLNPSTPEDLKTFDSARARDRHAGSEGRVPVHAEPTPSETLEAFGAPEDLYRALLPLALDVDELFVLLNRRDTRSMVHHVQHMLMAEFHAAAFRFDPAQYVDTIRSAALRTAWVAKRKRVHNVTGYFLKTLVTLLREAFMALSAGCVADMAKRELGLDDDDLVPYNTLTWEPFALILKDEARHWVGTDFIDDVARSALDLLLEEHRSHHTAVG